MWLIAIKVFRNFICLLIAWNHNNQFYSSQKCKFHFERIMTAVLFFWKIKLWKSCKKLVFQASRAVTVLTINEWNTLKVMIETELKFILEWSPVISGNCIINLKKIQLINFRHWIITVKFLIKKILPIWNLFWKNSS